MNDEGNHDKDLESGVVGRCRSEVGTGEEWWGYNNEWRGEGGVSG